MIIKNLTDKTIRIEIDNTTYTIEKDGEAYVEDFFPIDHIIKIKNETH